MTLPPPPAYRIGDYIHEPGEGIFPVIDGMQTKTVEDHSVIEYKDGRHRRTRIPEKRCFT